MRLSHNFTRTLKDAPADETAQSAQLLIRAGFIYKEMAGVYAYLPLGRRVLENIIQIVREEMAAAAGLPLVGDNKQADRLGHLLRVTKPIPMKRELKRP